MWVGRWILVSSAGWALATLAAFTGTWFVVEAVTGSADALLDDGAGFAIGLLAAFAIGGAGLGAAQWLLLRTRLARTGSWIWATALGWVTVAGLYVLLLDAVPGIANELVHNLAGGAVAGLAQARVLLANGVARARWWPAVSCAAFLCAAAVSALVAPLVGDESIGTIAGVAAMSALTGVALIPLVVRRNRPQHTGPDLAVSR